MSGTAGSAQMAQGGRSAGGGRVVVVTGATGGLGRAVVAAFAGAGDRVIGLARADDTGQGVEYVAVDVTDEQSVRAAVAEVERRHGGIGVLVNAVGAFAAGQPVAETDLATWRRMLDINATSAFLASKHVAPVMRRAGWGRIINVSSRSARGAQPSAAAYAVAKAAVVTLTEAQAAEEREHGITVNAILPSIIDTPANRTAMPDADIGRWPTPEAVARVILFLASHDAGLISGAAIPVYGLA